MTEPTPDQLDEHVRRLLQIRDTEPIELTPADLEAMAIAHRDGIVRMAAAELLTARTELASLKQDTQQNYAAIAAKQQRDATRITGLEREVKDAHIALDEARVRMAPGERIGYITGYRTADGDWSIEFDGAPFAAREEALADLVDAAEHCLPGLTCRTLTVYDEEIS